MSRLNAHTHTPRHKPQASAKPVIKPPTAIMTHDNQSNLKSFARLLPTLRLKPKVCAPHVDGLCAMHCALAAAVAALEVSDPRQNGHGGSGSDWSCPGHRNLLEAGEPEVNPRHKFINAQTHKIWPTSQFPRHLNRSTEPLPYKQP